MTKMTCLRCGQGFEATDLGDDHAHANVCLSTVAERDRLKRQNEEFIRELAGLRAFGDALRVGIADLHRDALRWLTEGTDARADLRAAEIRLFRLLQIVLAEPK